MQIVLFDPPERAKLFPLSATRAIADFRLGIFTMKERWQQITGKPVLVLTENYLQCLYEPIEAGDFLFINPTVFPADEVVIAFQQLEQGCALADEHGLLAGRVLLNGPAGLSELPGLFAKTTRIASPQKLEFPHHLFQQNDLWLRFDFNQLHAQQSAQLPAHVQAINPENIFIEEGADINFCCLNASTGPIYIGRNATIMEGCVVRGGLALCEGATLKMGAKIYGATTIGPYSSAGGEIKNTILFGYSNKAHDGYLGDSVIGQWCNMGAGTSNSNVKNTGGDVSVWNEFQQQSIKIGNKAGTIMGDYSRTAINTSLNTGTVAGVCCNIFSAGLPPKVIDNFAWGCNGDRYIFEKALSDITNWKKMKNQKLSSAEQSILKHIFDS